LPSSHALDRNASSLWKRFGGGKAGEDFSILSLHCPAPAHQVPRLMT
jgi:hypothetical protein